MDEPSQLSEYGYILLFSIVGLLLVCATILASKILSPKKPNPIKLSTYECGEEAIGSSWVQFNPRFYVVALIFLLFDVELIFIFPWATVFGNATLQAADNRWGIFTLLEMGIFIGILILGLVYVWYRGDLNWVKPQRTAPRVEVPIPMEAYAALNSRVYTPRVATATSVPSASPSTAATASAPQIGFKPRFKK